MKYLSLNSDKPNRKKRGRLVSHAHLVHKFNSVRLLIVTFVLNSAAGIWGSLPNAFVDKLPPTLIFSISTVVALLTIVLSYLRQDKVESEMYGDSDETPIK